MKDWKDQLDRFRDAWDSWGELIEQRRSEIQQWDLERFWMIVDEPSHRVSQLVRQFVERWIQLVRSSNQARELWGSDPGKIHVPKSYQSLSLSMEDSISGTKPFLPIPV